MDLQQTPQARADLETGRGVYTQSEAGRALLDLYDAEAAAKRVRSEAEYAPRWRQRRAAAKQAAAWAEHEADARHRIQIHWVPEAARLDSEIRQREKALAEIVSRAEKTTTIGRLCRAGSQPGQQDVAAWTCLIIALT